MSASSALPALARGVDEDDSIFFGMGTGWDSHQRDAVLAAFPGIEIDVKKLNLHLAIWKYLEWAEAGHREQWGWELDGKTVELRWGEDEEEEGL